MNCKTLCRWAIGAAVWGASALCIAQSVPSAAGKAWTGYAGAGAASFPKYTGGTGAVIQAVPLLLFEYKETFYVDFVRAGVRLWSSEDKKLAFGLAAEPRFGYTAKDGPRLGGMAKRRSSIEIGPSLEWETKFASYNLAAFRDATGTSKGASYRATAYKQFIDTAQWDIGAYASVEREDGKVINYYFGVPAVEANINRPFYQAGASNHWTLGISGAWKFSPRYALLFGVQNTRLGAAAANSPIVETRNAPIAYIGLGWQL